MIKTYWEKAGKIDALQWTGENIDEVEGFAPGLIYTVHKGRIRPNLTIYPHCEPLDVGDYITKNMFNEIFSCKQDIFPQDYEEVGE